MTGRTIAQVAFSARADIYERFERVWRELWDDARTDDEMLGWTELEWRKEFMTRYFDKGFVR